MRVPGLVQDCWWYAHRDANPRRWALHCKAPTPTQHVEDARAMFYAETIKPLTAEELSDRVPTVKPTLGDIVNESAR